MRLGRNSHTIRDFTGLLQWVPVATARVVQLSLTADQGVYTRKTCHSWTSAGQEFDEQAWHMRKDFVRIFLWTRYERARWQCAMPPSRQHHICTTNICVEADLNNKQHRQTQKQTHTHTHIHTHTHTHTHTHKEKLMGAGQGQSAYVAMSEKFSYWGWHWRKSRPQMIVWLIRAELSWAGLTNREINKGFNKTLDSWYFTPNDRVRSWQSENTSNQITTKSLLQKQRNKPLCLQMQSLPLHNKTEPRPTSQMTSR